MKIIEASQYHCSIDAYHADRTAWSHSQIEDLVPPAGAPELFHERHVARTIARKASTEMEAGNLVHQVVLSGDPHAMEIIPPHALSANGQRRGKAWEEFCVLHSEKVLLKPDEAEPIAKMVASVWAEPAAADLLKAEGPVEASFRGYDERTSEPLRARPDKIVVRQPGHVDLVDLKTARAIDPRSFQGAAVQYGYHRQAAWYMDLVSAALGVVVDHFYLIAVEKSEPYRTVVYMLSDEAIDLGREQNDSAIADLAARIKSGCWTSPTHGVVQRLDLPAWAYPKVELKSGGKSLATVN